MNVITVKGTILNKNQSRIRQFMGTPKEASNLTDAQYEAEHKTKIVSTLTVELTENAPRRQGMFGGQPNTLNLDVSDELFDQVTIGREVDITVTVK